MIIYQSFTVGRVCMRYNNHPGTAAVDTCSECGQVIYGDDSILINDRVTCKSCIVQKVDLLVGLPKCKTLKEPSYEHRSLYSGLITNLISRRA